MEPSTLEIIDRSMFEWIDAKIDVNSSTNKGWKKVPVIWVSAERAFQIKRDRDLRDQSGTVILPAVTVERISVTKSTKRAPFGNLPNAQDEKGGAHIIKRRIKQDKTANFQNAEANYDFGQENFPSRNQNKPQVLFARPLAIRDKIVYETITIPQPVFVEIGYKIGIRTEYLEQLNEIVSPFAVHTGNIRHFYIASDHHAYEAFFDDDFSPQSNAASLQTEERRYETSMSVTVLGYLIGADKNQKQPKIVVRESVVEINIPRERVIYGDIPRHISDKEGFYRE